MDVTTVTPQKEYLQRKMSNDPMEEDKPKPPKKKKRINP
jgi:hypothetical protein